LITKFSDLFENYESFSNKKYILNKVTPRLIWQVSDVFIKGIKNKVQNYSGQGRLDEEQCLKELCNIICTYAEIDKTGNWAWYFLIEDYKDAFQRFLVKPFPKFMDVTSKVALEFLEGKITKDLNAVFFENNFGYRLQNNVQEPWICIDPQVSPLKD
jgi:hypothetical protein